jgi:hypothetical protein
MCNGQDGVRTVYKIVIKYYSTDGGIFETSCGTWPELLSMHTSIAELNSSYMSLTLCPHWSSHSKNDWSSTRPVLVSLEFTQRLKFTHDRLLLSSAGCLVFVARPMNLPDQT